YNALFDTGRQIVITSDMSPRELRALDERLRQRFEQGLIADIAPPDYEMREAILRQRCAALEAACAAAPRTAAELLPTLFDRAITDPHQLRFAMGEAIAHLVHLEAQGRLRRQRAGGIVRFA
ncbi:MAG: DnaA/Hda family protein, partial [Rhodocyclaceae bacterium]|nr:DnaA/Hda family protein [Rhodocyclaceae bacterium]